MALIIEPDSKPLRKAKIDDIYFAYPAMSRSMLKAYKGSDKVPETIKDLWNNPKSFAPRSRSLILGHAFENLVLNPRRYKTDFYVTMFEGWRKHYKFLKALRNRGVEPIKRSEHNNFTVMRDNLLQVPLVPLWKYGIKTVKDLLDQDFETQVMKVFRLEGVTCKVLVDIYLKLPDDRVFICDLKTSRSTIDATSFFFDAVKYGYDIQGTFYLMAFKNERVLPYFPFLVANTVSPFLVNAYNFTNDFFKKTRTEILSLIHLHNAINVNNVNNKVNNDDNAKKDCQKTNDIRSPCATS